MYICSIINNTSCVHIYCRYKLHFLKESDDDIRKRKVDARIPQDDLPEVYVQCKKKL